jgi:hypothetical protein
MKRISNEIELWTVDNLVSTKECQQLIKEAGIDYNPKNSTNLVGSGFKPSEVQSNINIDVDPSSGKGAMKTFSRNSYTSFVKDSPLTKLFIKRAKSIISDITDKPIGTTEGIQVQRYHPGQKYNPHYDTFEGKDSVNQRSWTVMIYLNEDCKGGTTYFPKVGKGLRISPKEGMAAVWNNLDTDYCRKQKTLHMGEEVTEGVKYIVTVWFRNPPGPEYKCSQIESFKSHRKKEPKELVDDSYFPCWWDFFLLLFGVMVIGLLIMSLF